MIKVAGVPDCQQDAVKNLVEVLPFDYTERRLTNT